MFNGPATYNLFASDMSAAIAWYSTLFGSEPYFTNPTTGTPAYAEWRIGDSQTEVGLVDAGWAPYPVGQPSGALLYWAVDDLQSALARLLELGASQLEPVTERGPGFVTAAVVDPFGNVLGIMTNVRYQQVHQSVTDRQSNQNVSMSMSQ